MARYPLTKFKRGFIRLSKARSAGQSRAVQRQARAGELVKIRPGLYRTVLLEGRPHQDLIDACAAIPDGVICLVSALAYHGLTTTMPKEAWVAIPRNAYAPVMCFPCRFIRMGDGIHQAGVETLKVEQQGQLRIYGRAVSICQALHYRERIGLDLALEALRTYLRQGEVFGHWRNGQRSVGSGKPWPLIWKRSCRRYAIPFTNESLVLAFLKYIFTKDSLFLHSQLNARIGIPGIHWQIGERWFSTNANLAGRDLA
jgi:hypothetical protein